MRCEREETDIIGEKREAIAEKFRTGKKLSDEEALALLLSYTVKKRDTSVLAERLLFRFHGLSGVLEAPVAMLVSVPGITPFSAAALKLIPALLAYRYRPVLRVDEKKARRSEDEGNCAADKEAGPEPAHGDCRVSGSDAAEVRRLRRPGAVKTGKQIPTLSDNLKRMRVFFSGEKREVVGALLFDRKGMPVSFCRIGKGENGVTTADMRVFIRELIRSGAESVLLAHNHPDGPALFSDSDRLAAEEIRSVLSGFGVETIGYAVFGRRRSKVLFYRECGEEGTDGIPDNYAGKKG